MHCKEKVQVNEWLCNICTGYLTFIDKVSLPYLTTLEAEGPALALIQATQSPTAERIAKSMAALMVIQMERLRIALPDVIAIFPRQADVFNPLLANSLGQFLSIPVLNPLRAPSYLFPRYRWKDSIPLSDKKVFFISLYKPDPEEIWIVEEAAPQECTFFSFV